VLLDASGYIGCMHWTRTESAILDKVMKLDKLTKYPARWTPHERTLGLLAIRMLLVSLAPIIPGLFLTVLGAVADWPVINLAGTVLLVIPIPMLALAQVVIFIVAIVYRV
jgi:hypothetical protein